MVEIDSFTSKFKHLLGNGYKATLTLEAIDGEAFVTLKAGLGSKCSLPLAPSQNCQTQNYGNYHSLKQRSHSYYRRQKRRKLSNKNMCAEKAPLVAVDKTYEEYDADKLEKVSTTGKVDSEEISDTEANSVVYSETDVYTYLYLNNEKKSIEKDAGFNGGTVHLRSEHDFDELYDDSVNNILEDFAYFNKN